MTAVGVLAVIRRERAAAWAEIEKADGRPGKDLNRLTEKQADAVIARMERAAVKRRARYDAAKNAEAAVAELMEAHATLLAQVDAGTSADYRALQETAVVRRSRTALARCGK